MVRSKRQDNKPGNVKGLGRGSLGKAIHQVERQLKNQKNDIRSLQMLRKSYYEKGDDKNALRIAYKVWSIAPDDPLLIWQYAACLSNVGRYKEAIGIYQKILRKSPSALASNKKIGTLRRAKGLKNDCVCAIGECQASLENWYVAIKLFKKYLKNRQTRVPSVYEVREVKVIKQQLLSMDNTARIEKSLAEEHWKKAQVLILDELKRSCTFPKKGY
jgi:tetratricopeptide (TPR) repeat protein